MAFLSKKLATIKTDCELDYKIDDSKLENIFTPEAFELPDFRTEARFDRYYLTGYCLWRNPF